MSRIHDLEVRMKGVEAAVDGLRHSQNMGLGLLGVVIALLTFGGGYVLNRVDALDTKVDSLPDEINRNLLDLTQTVTQGITAARVAQPAPAAPAPQVIIIPSPPYTAGMNPPQQ